MDKARQREVLLFVLDALEKLNKSGLIHVTIEDGSEMTEEGRHQIEIMQKYGLDPTSEELDAVLTALMDEGVVKIDFGKQ